MNSPLYKLNKWVYINHVLKNAPVAQLDRASGYGPEGREFESCPAHEKNSFIIIEKTVLFLYLLRKIHGKIVFVKIIA